VEAINAFEKRGPPIGFVTIRPISEDPVPTGVVVNVPTKRNLSKRGPPIGSVVIRPITNSSQSEDPSDGEKIKRDVVDLQERRYDDELNSTLSRRASLPSLKCGDNDWQWATIADKTSYDGSIQYGYTSGVTAFCSQLDGVTIPIKHEASVEVHQIWTTYYNAGNLIGSFPLFDCRLCSANETVRDDFKHQSQKRVHGH
jgi:hypothetical protein